MQNLDLKHAKRALLVAMVMFFATGCEQDPDRWNRGYKLEGETTSQMVDDWSFTRDIQEIYIEVSPWYQVPHSVTIWCFDVDGNLYIGSYRERKTWEDVVASNADIRLKIDGVIYAMHVEPQIEDAALIARLDEVLESKYDLQAVFGDTRHQWWYYPVSQRAP